MGNTLLFLSVASLLVLSTGTALIPNNSAFWLSSGSLSYQIIRGGLSCILLNQLFTKPPRKIWFRVFVGFVSTAVLTWTIQTSYNYQMFALDSLALIAACLAISITALERKERTDDFSGSSYKMNPKLH